MGVTAWGLAGAKNKRAQQVGYGMENQIWQVVSGPGPEGPDRPGRKTKPRNPTPDPTGHTAPERPACPKTKKPQPPAGEPPEPGPPPPELTRQGPRCTLDYVTTKTLRASLGTDRHGRRTAGKRACRQAAGTGRVMLAISISNTLPLVCQVNKGTWTL